MTDARKKYSIQLFGHPDASWDEIQRQAAEIDYENVGNDTSTHGPGGLTAKQLVEDSTEHKD